MPEGDTVWKVARVLERDLVGRSLKGFWLRNRGEVPPLVGATIDAVETRGKHMLVGIAGERRWHLHVHLGMKGRWDRYRKGETWERPTHHAGTRIDTEGYVHVCFRPMVAELLTETEVLGHARLGRLGPDLLGENVNTAEIVERARRRAPHTVTDLLLDQTIASGLGNEYRNELLFEAGLHPETAPTALDDQQIEALFTRGRELLLGNLGGWKRTTTRAVTADRPLARGEQRTYVHGRTGRPCPRCGAPIRAGRAGDGARATYWCPACQPAPRP